MDAERPGTAGYPKHRSLSKLSASKRSASKLSASMVRSLRRCSMRLSTVCPAALLFTLALAVILLFSSNTLAQHSGGGGGSSGGGSSGASSSGGGGGSHGGSSGGSASSGSSASHSSGGSAHSSSAHSSGSAPASSPSAARGAQSKASHSIHEANAGVQKRSFFSFFVYPFRRPKPTPAPAVRPVADLRRPVCFKGPCPVCPERGCGGTVVDNAYNFRRHCPGGAARDSGACLPQPLLDDCSGLRLMMERQAQRMQAAEAARQSACSTDPQQCSAASGSADSEASFYRELQNRYQACQRRSPTAFPFSGFGERGYSAGLSFDLVR